MSKLMNLTGNIVDIFDLQKEDISAEVIMLLISRKEAGWR